MENLPVELLALVTYWSNLTVPGPNHLSDFAIMEVFKMHDSTQFIEDASNYPVINLQRTSKVFKQIVDSEYNRWTNTHPSIYSTE